MQLVTLFLEKTKVLATSYIFFAIPPTSLISLHFSVSTDPSSLRLAFQ